MKTSLPLTSVLICFGLLTSQAQSLMHVTHSNGLPSSAVLSICQDSNGVLWIGTLDGLCYFDGRLVRKYPFGSSVSLNGHIVEQIVQTASQVLWIDTTYGLYRLDKASGEVQMFSEFDGRYRIHNAGNGDLLILDKKQAAHLYLEADHSLVPLEQPMSAGETILGIGGSEEGFWAAGDRGIVFYDWERRDGSRTGLGRITKTLPMPLAYCLLKDRDIFVVDTQGMLSSVEPGTGAVHALLNIGKDIRLRGKPTGLLQMNGDLFLSFDTGGVLRYRKSKSGSWERYDIGINSGIFMMDKDRKHDILYIATDGQGVYTYWEGENKIKSFLSTEIDPGFDKPVRALFVDRENHLWVGSKGSGLMCLQRSNRDGKETYVLKRLYRKENSRLQDNVVYVMGKSRYDGFWIGSESGLDFYDYRSRDIISVQSPVDIRFVHGIHETADGTLWIATVGTGIYRVEIVRTDTGIRLAEVRNYTLAKGNFSSNFFFSLFCEDDGTIWLGNRGSGLYKIGPEGLKTVPLMTERARSLAVNDVFSLAEGNNRIWAGTGAGLICLSGEDIESFYDSDNGLPNSIVHSILPDRDGAMWIATNNGLAKLERDFSEFEIYDNRNGLDVIEFSDAAAHRSTGTLYFGGVNGWVEISANDHCLKEEEDVPPVIFTEVGIGGSVLPVTSAAADREIRLQPGENAFSARFAGLDYKGRKNFDYYYRLSRLHRSGEWVLNGAAEFVNFTNLRAGRYTLEVKSRNRRSGLESSPVQMWISVSSPWYASLPFRVFSLLTLVSAATVLTVQLSKRASQRRKEKLYEEKLRFFTNITHEFFTPLTLISNPCERILSHNGTDEFTRKYVDIIKSNSERLNALIQEIIDYRRLETNHQTYQLKRVDLSAESRRAVESFADMAEENGIRLEQDIPRGIVWNMDLRCYSKIILNLISNAMKYTKRGGLIKVTLSADAGDLRLKVYNTGKGIKNEDIGRIFNRYCVLDNIEEKAIRGLTSRNGLGLAICNSMARLLQGSVEVNSKVDEYAEFVVTLPLLPLGPEASSASPAVDEPPRPAQRNHPDPNSRKPRILAVDDNAGIRFLLRESLSGDYSMETAANAAEALELLKADPPDLIISDIMMEGTDGFTFTRLVKENKHTMHIPLILLSARNTLEDKVRGLHSGGDAYITKPFNINYLRATVNQLLRSRSSLEEYYSTSASAYEYSSGQLLKREDREFLEAFNTLIDRTLHEGLSIPEVAEHLHMSVRNFYRKFSELNLGLPTDYVNDRKMAYAAKKIVTSSLTIKEIVFESGFNNRAHFYKEFSKRYGMTPKEYRTRNKRKDSSLTDAYG